MSKLIDPWDKAGVGKIPSRPPRRADVEKEDAERRTLASVPPANIIRRPLELPPMERVQGS